jgi:PiT family inorganic phosphate transporter
VGCGLLSFKKAVLLVAVFVILGGVFQGQHVMETIGNGIVRENLNYPAVLVTLICSGLVVTVATFLRIPTSTSQAIVGGLIGVGLAMGSKIHYHNLYTIAASWIVCPLLAVGLSFSLFHLLGFILQRIRANAMLIQNVMARLAILASCYVAYTLGANHAGSAMGPISSLGIIHPVILLGIGGISIAIGAVSYGQKVTDTVGKGITPLDVSGAFVVQISSAFGIHLFTIFGIPISTSSAIVGAVVGVGLVKGAKTISRKTIVTIFIGWILTPCSAAVGSYIMYKAIKLVFS